jgi:hypothetical protein
LSSSISCAVAVTLTSSRVMMAEDFIHEAHLFSAVNLSETLPYRSVHK